MTTQQQNGGLDTRRWHQLKAERDDLPLLTTNTVIVEGANTVEQTNVCKCLTPRGLCEVV